MATSGTIGNTFRTGYRVQIAWNVTSQNVAANTSDVAILVQLVSLGSSYTINSSATKNGSLTVNGTTYNYTFNASLSGNQTKTIHSRTVTVPHNADGSKTCSFSCAAGIAVTLSGTYFGTVSASGSGVFNSIARATTPTLSAGTINIGSAVTINTPRASSSFTHTLTYAFGNRSGTIATSVGTSASWTLPMGLCNATPSATSGRGTITCTTYNGGTLIGSKSISFTGIVPASVVPTISSVSLSEAVSGIASKFGGYVQNKSRVAVSVASAGSYSSSISSVRSTLLGATYTGASFTSGLLSNSGTLSITVTDSRGRTASTTRAVTVLAYTSPTITSFSCFRSTSAGAENYEGTNARVNASFTIASVGAKNDNSYRFEYRLQGASNWTTLTNGNSYAYNTGFTTGAIFGVDAGFEIRLTITDFFGSVSKTIELPTAFTLVDYNKTGKAIAFGKVSQLGTGVEFGMPVTMNPPLPIGSGGTGANGAAGARSNLGLGSASTENIIPVAKGGTGANNSASARNNLGLGNTSGALPIANGGTGANNSASARSSLGFGGKILWSGGMYMTAGHTATLSESISAQPSGIVLIFSRYSSSTVQNYHYAHFFVSKQFVAAHAGVGSQFLLTTDGLFSVMACKYLYIHNDRIVGNANNNARGTGSGITFDNAGFVMRYVIGV